MQNPLRWEAAVPGKEKTDWEGGVYPLLMEFPATYPQNPPSVRFVGVGRTSLDRDSFCHPNVYPDGRVCLDIIGNNWEAGLTIQDVLKGIQELLDEPNNTDPASSLAYSLYKDSRRKYNEKVRAQAKRYAP